MSDTKPIRSWFRFSLRTLLLATTVLCVWLAMQVNAARRQKEAVKVILGAGGTVRYDYQYKRRPSMPAVIVGGVKLPDHFFDNNATIPGPVWLRKFDC